MIKRNKLNLTKKKNVDKLLKKHFGEQWRQTIFYGLPNRSLLNNLGLGTEQNYFT